MRLRVLLCALVAAGILATTACLPNLDRLLEGIRVALNNVIGGDASHGVTSCAVILFDQSVDPATNKAFYTPVYPPNDIYLWVQACLGQGRGKTSVPTYKASGYAQGGDFNKRAVCWALPLVPDGTTRFPCAFDTRPGAPPNGFDWVKYLSTSFNGEMKVGSLG